MKETKKEVGGEGKGREGGRRKKRKKPNFVYNSPFLEGCELVLKEHSGQRHAAEYFWLILKAF